LAHVVFECDRDDSVDYGLIACVGNRPIEVADSRSDKVLRGAGFKVRELEVGSICRGFGRRFLLGPENHNENANDHRNDR
jgi:hypothetical protein